MIKLILAELGKPDDQGKDWYGWASNQMSHAFLGVMAFGLFGWVGVIVLALAKEAFDMIKARGKLLDSAQDALFWLLGALVVAATDKIAAVILVVFALLCGVIPRVRNVKRGS